MMDMSFARYMNPPECSVSVGDVCERTDTDCENPYTVKEIRERNGKFGQFALMRTSFQEI